MSVWVIGYLRLYVVLPVLPAVERRSLAPHLPAGLVTEEHEQHVAILRYMGPAYFATHLSCDATLDSLRTKFGACAVACVKGGFAAVAD